MTDAARQSHWESIHADREPGEVSWFQESPVISMALIERTGIPADAPIVDAGGGVSRLVDRLLDDGRTDVTVVDISESALRQSRERLGARAKWVRWVVSDVVDLDIADASVALWHDRAVFHFLTDPAERRRYVQAVGRWVRPDGYLVIGTFADDGPQRCSGLPVHRHSPGELVAAFSQRFEPVETRRHTHVTPQGRAQPFVFALLRRRPDAPPPSP